MAHRGNRKAAEDLDVDLIVMATHERARIDRLFIGSIAEHILRSSKRPVLTFGPETTIGALKKVLCLVDFDPDSIAALNFGWRVAQRYNAALSLLRVVPMPFEPSEQPVEPSTPEWGQDARARLVTVAAEILGAKTKCELMVRRGDPASAILIAIEKVVKQVMLPGFATLTRERDAGLSPNWVRNARAFRRVVSHSKIESRKNLAPIWHRNSRESKKLSVTDGI